MHYFLFMLESDLLGLLKPEQDEEEEFVQSAEISDYDLQIALDCEYLKVDIAKCINLMFRCLPWKEVGVHGGSGGNLLSSIEGYWK